MKANVLLVVPAVILMMVSAGASHAQSANASMDTAMSATAGPTAMSQKQADRALSRSVRRALTKSPGFNVSGVFVRARGGVVTLSGSARDGDQLRQAEEVARSVPGVSSVSNQLTLFHGGNG